MSEQRRPCAECRKIKERYYRAWRAGDREQAEELTTIMGRHLRDAHGT
ncbi:hypothetical protein I5Q34_19390 [Streptomyces sp. AV19]|nr:hypothetical protein [Streptomyces sp. AV19]MBH1936412.1 hypothetical protein [Streptomyces sp. AV19]MDG4532451.1 hypothetical protein [Streptomyces sp. AV19]